MSEVKKDFDSIDEAIKSVKDIADTKTRALNYYAPLFISNSKGQMTDKTNELYNELVRVHKSIKNIAFSTIEVIENNNGELCDD